MKINNTLTALIASATLGLSGQALAAGTTSGTPIVNTVSLGYTVSSTAQTPVTSTETFNVDNKVDMTLTTDTPDTNPAPGQEIILAYTLTNTGNKVQPYVLSLSDNGNADHAPQAVTFWSDAAANTTQLTDGNTGDLAVGTPFTAYARVTLSNNLNIVNGTTVAMRLLASAANASTGTALLAQDIAGDKNQNLTNEYVVFAEPSSVSNLAHTGGITIQTDRVIQTATFEDPNATAVPTLAIEIINDVICDSSLTSTSTTNYATGGANVGTCPDVIAANKTTYRPKAIPTSMAEFTYNAKNKGSKTANAVVFTETLETGYTDASIDNLTLTVSGTAQTLNEEVNVGLVDAANDWHKDDTTGTLTVYVGDVINNAGAGNSGTVAITFTAIVE